MTERDKASFKDRTLATSLDIAPERIRTVLEPTWETLQQHSNASDGIKSLLEMLAEGKLSPEEFAFMVFDLGWLCACKSTIHFIKEELLDMGRAPTPA